MRKIASGNVTSKSKIIAEDKVANTITVAIPAREFLFTQASICASVMLEPNSHLIHPMFSKYVNNNGDTWSNESLLANKDSWIGAFNYVNHKDGEENGVGLIPDVTLRVNFLDPKKNLFNYYADILIATHRDFGTLVDGIATNKILYMSMGCDAEIITCSKCGHVSSSEHDSCDHSLNAKGKYFIDNAGVRRICADVLGTKEKGSTTFVEASWLTVPPAFHGAVKRNVLPIEKDKMVHVIMPTKTQDRIAYQKFLG